MCKGPSPSGKANVAFPVQSGAIHRQGMNEVKTVYRQIQHQYLFSSTGAYAKIFVKVAKVARVAKVAKVASD